MTLAEVIDTIQTWIRNADDEYDREEMGRVAGLKEALHEIKKIDLCEDAISREDALQALCQAVHKNDDSIPCSNQRVSCLWNKTKVQDYAEEILKLPPVTPQPKTGYWYIDERPESDREVICSNCEQSVFKYHKLDFDYRPRYCPNCGAKMESEGINDTDKR